ncbi:MAG TPA: glutamine--tRNA ligase, partial [Methylotenera mobilis]|nr:glutamine--tRNA ligase [Methylotenera mobilis]
WVSVAHAYEAEVRLYDRLFKEAHPGEGKHEDGRERDFLDDINQDSVQVITTQLELSLKDAKPEESFQFERHGYFVADKKDSVAGKPVFNRTVTLRDAWQK